MHARSSDQFATPYAGTLVLLGRDENIPLAAVFAPGSFEQAGPTHARRHAMRVIGCVPGILRLGTIAARSLAWDASTPWKRVNLR